MGVSVPFRGSCSEMKRSVRSVHGHKRHVSVPFRGSCSEIEIYVINNKTAIVVSVPFRGSCSEIVKTFFHYSRQEKFPSPFGVRVLK